MMKNRISLLLISILLSYSALSQTDPYDDGFQIDAYAGAISNSFPDKIKGRYDSYKSDASISPAFGINFLYTIPTNVQRVKFGLSLGYNSYNANSSHAGANNYSRGVIYYTTTYNENIILKNTLLATNLYTMVVVNPGSKIQAYVKVGLNTNFSMGTEKFVISENSSVTDGMTGSSPIHSSGSSTDQLAKFNQIFIALQTGAGIAIGKSKIEFCYWPSSNQVQSSPPAASMQKSFTMTAMGIFYYYRFAD